MRNNVAFLTTIFPMDKSYLFDFFNSLQKQTYKNFDVIVINDNYDGFDEVEQAFTDLNIIELNYSGTPAKNREYGINYVIDSGYDVLIFGDSDDYFDSDRIQVSIDSLNDYDIVVNEISLFNTAGIYSNKYISNRVQDNTQISLDFIKDKNIFGLSNTALRVSILDRTGFDQDLVAVDWYLYTKLLLKNAKAIFTNKTQTYYRQYESNTIGIGVRSDETIKKTRLVKSKHYSLLAKENSMFKELNEREKNIQMNNEYYELSRQKNKTPLWWED